MANRFMHLPKCFKPTTQLTLFLFISVHAHCQKFQLVQSTFENIAWSEMLAEDLDKDGDNDVILIGKSQSGGFSQVYLNDGKGNFLAGQSLLPQVYSGSISLGDIDLDGDFDLFICGLVNDTTHKAELLLNDGAGNFSTKNDIEIPAISFGSSAFADINGDHFPDLVLLGAGPDKHATGKIFINDTKGGFSAENVISITGLTNADLILQDFDLDSDLDLICIGLKDQKGYSYIYKNSGDGNLSKVDSTTFPGVYSGTICSADINLDGFPDVFITGFDSQLGKPVSKLFKNTGDFRFESFKSSFPGFVIGSSAFGDFNGDIYPDLFIQGYNQDLRENKALIYLNDRGISFSELSSAKIQPLVMTSSVTTDLNGDGRIDLLTSGMSNETGTITQMYLNQPGCQSEETYFRTTGCDSYTWIDGVTYYEDNNTAFVTLKNQFGCDSTVHLRLHMSTTSFHRDTVVTRKPYRWIDYNFYAETQSGITKTISKPNGCDSIITLDLEVIREISAGGFRRDTTSTLELYQYQNYSFGDIDADGDLDIMLTGKHELSDPDLVIYLNSGEGKYMRKDNFFGLPNLIVSDLFCGDLDNDGDDDLVVWGYDTNIFQYTSLRLIHDSGSQYTIDKNSGIPFKRPTSYRFSDLEGDGDPDLLILEEGMRLISMDTVFNEVGLPIQFINPVYSFTSNNSLFINDGSGFFKNKPDHGIEDFGYTRFTMSDMDSDGDMDVLASIYNRAIEKVHVMVYQQDTPGHFLKAFQLQDTLKWQPIIEFVNYNNDEVKEILISGSVDSITHINRIYRIDTQGQFSFTEEKKLSATSRRIYADVDNDGDSDFIDQEPDHWPNLSINDGTGTFRESDESPFLVWSSTFYEKPKMIDLNKDGYLDYLSEGHIYLNENCLPDYREDSVFSFYPYTWIDGKTYSKSNNTARVVFKNEFGCDSVIVLNLTVNNTPRGEGFIEITPDHISGSRDGLITLADINSDRTIDFAISSLSSRNGTKVYLNDGNRQISNHLQSGFSDELSNKSVFNDIDGDSYPDLIIGGSSFDILKNDGQGNFISTNQVLVSEMSTMDFVVSDIDMDGHSDILLSGYNERDRIYITKAFFNNGKGTFSSRYFGFVDGFVGDLELVDLDGDIDPDLIIRGYNSERRFLKIYKNDGIGRFSEFESNLPVVTSGKMTLKDLDNDFDADMVISGWKFGENQIITRLFANDGNGHFSETIALSDKYLFWSMDFADIDGDGDLDLLVQEEDNSTNLFTSIYQNEGNLTFKRTPKKSMSGLRFGDIKVADLDGDSAPDIIVTGVNNKEKEITNIYYNENPEQKLFPSYHTQRIISDTPVQWIDGKTYTETSNTIEYVLKNEAGGDSVIHLQLLIKEKALASAPSEIKDFVFPNPASQTVRVELGDKPKGIIKYSIFRIDGQKVDSWQSNLEFQSIDISNYAPGTYLLRYSHSGKENTLKFIKL